jgi:hypothetical protein
MINRGIKNTWCYCKPRGAKTIWYQKLLRKIIGLMLIGLLLGACSASSEIEGTLRDKEDLTPVTGASVVLCEIIKDGSCVLQPDLVVSTDELGSFNLPEIPSGSYILLFHLPSFQCQMELSEEPVVFDEIFPFPINVLGDGQIITDACLLFSIRDGEPWPFVEVRGGQHLSLDLPL